MQIGETCLLCERVESGSTRRPAGTARQLGSGAAALAALAAVVHQVVLAAPVRHKVHGILLCAAAVALLARYHLSSQSNPPS